MTPAKVFETSITTADNSPSQDYTHLNDQTILYNKWFDRGSSKYNFSNSMIVQKILFETNLMVTVT